MSRNMKSICLMVRDDQYEKLHQMDVNMSGFIRDLIDDHYSQGTITLNVSEETRKLYDQIVSNAPQGDVDIEPYLRSALRAMLKDKIREMEKLQKALERE